MTMTRAIFRAVRTCPWSARHALIVALGVLLAVGALASTPAKAYAAVPEVRTPLHSGLDSSGPLAVFGSNVVFGTHRSTDGGATWTSDPALASTSWQFTGNGKLVGYVSSSGSYLAVVYTVASGAQQTYTLPSYASSMNDTWALWWVPSISSDVAYDFVHGGSTIVLTPPTGASVTSPTPEITPSGAVLWSGRTADSRTVFAVANSPTSAPGSWVSIDGAIDSTTTATQLVYVVETTSSIQICSRPLASLSSIPTCGTAVPMTFDFAVAQLLNFGTTSVANIWAVTGAEMTLESFYWNGSSATLLSPPANSYIDQPWGAGPNRFGDTPYVLVRDANTVPSIQKVNANGTLSPGFALPPTAAAANQYLAVAPDRVVGADNRDGATEVPSWTLTVSASGFGSEALLPARASWLAASAARTVVSGPDGLSVYDRGTLRNTISDAHLAQLSGPYYTRLGWNVAAGSSEMEVEDVNGATVGAFLGISGTLFGSEYVTWTTDQNASGSAHVVINDLTRASSARTVDLPPGTAVCGTGQVWSNTLFMTCGTKLQAFNLQTGALLATLSAPTGQFVNLMDVGDGYAITTFNNSDFNLWNVGANTLSPLDSCTSDVTSDGIGHVGCSSDTHLIWRDFSAMSTSAPRLLGALANPSADFSDPGMTWKVEFDATKPLKAGTLVISRIDGTVNGTVVRTLATPASTDGSIRGVTWDGFDTSGKPAPAGAYTYRLVADAADGSGAVVSVDGTGTASGKFTVASANPVGMSPGSLMAVSPSRLLDTRTTGGKLGAAESRSIQVTGVGGVPSTNVSAVVLNVTVTETTNGGYLTVSPTGTTRPTASNLNWSGGGTTIPNAVTVKVGTGGKVDLYQSGPGTAQVIVDVAGYYIAGTVTDPGGFTAVTPARILDTRSNGGALKAAESRDLQVTGAGGVPASNVSAVVLNVTVTATTAGGYLSAYPGGTTKPTASNLNWSGSGVTIPNQVVVKIGDSGKISLFQSGPGTAQVIADVAGYFLGGSATKPGMFVALSPARVLDTRSTGAVAGGADATLAILGKGGLPASGVAAVVVNTTVTQTTAGGYLTVYPGTNPLPTASNLNWSGPGTTIPNLVAVQTGSDGTIKFHNGSPGTTQIIADTAGYYIAS